MHVLLNEGKDLSAEVNANIVMLLVRVIAKCCD